MLLLRRNVTNVDINEINDDLELTKNKLINRFFFQWQLYAY